MEKKWKDEFSFKIKTKTSLLYFVCQAGVPDGMHANSGAAQEVQWSQKNLPLDLAFPWEYASWNAKNEVYIENNNNFILIKQPFGKRH